MIFYYNNQKKVVMYSQELQEGNSLSFIEYVPTSEEMALIKQNYKLLVENGKLVILEPENIRNQKQIDDLESTKAKLKEKIKNKTATLDDVFNFLSKL